MPQRDGTGTNWSLPELVTKILAIEIQVNKLVELTTFLQDSLAALTLRFNQLPMIESKGYRDSACKLVQGTLTGWCPNGQKMDFWIPLTSYQEGDVIQLQVTAPIITGGLSVIPCEIGEIQPNRFTVPYVHVFCTVAPSNDSVYSYSSIRPTAIMSTGFYTDG